MVCSLIVQDKVTMAVRRLSWRSSWQNGFLRRTLTMKYVHYTFWHKTVVCLRHQHLLFNRSVYNFWLRDTGKLHFSAFSANATVSISKKKQNCLVKKLIHWRGKDKKELQLILVVVTSIQKRHLSRWTYLEYSHICLVFPIIRLKLTTV